MPVWPIALALVAAGFFGTAAAQTAPAPQRPAVLDETVSQIPQTAPGSPWSFIGFGIVSPEDARWFVATSSPRGGVLGRSLSTTELHTALIVVSSELLDQPLPSDAEFLAGMRDRHAKLAERWTILQHEETAVRHAGARCARHTISARQPEDRSPRKDAAKADKPRGWLHITGTSCVHPTEPRLLIEVGVSERSPAGRPNAALQAEAEKMISGLSFQRYAEAALQKSAEMARAGQVQEAEAILKPFVDADAAWARYFLAQILQRSTPPPKEVGIRLRALLEPAAERGLSDAQWMLGTLFLRGAPGLTKDPALAEALLRRAAERANAGAAFQLGIALLSRDDGLTPNQPEAVLWISRAAARGQKEAQQLLASTRSSGPASAPAPAAVQPPAAK
jgi:hypothetical protein